MKRDRLFPVEVADNDIPVEMAENGRLQKIQGHGETQSCPLHERSFQKRFQYRAWPRLLAFRRQHLNLSLTTMIRGIHLLSLLPSRWRTR